MYRTPFTAVPSPGEVNDKPSVTIQGESYTIPELLRKFSNGQTVAVSRQPVYQSTDDFDAPDLVEVMNSDLVDRDIITSLNKQKVNELYEKAKESSKPADVPVVEPVAPNNKGE